MADREILFEQLRKRALYKAEIQKEACLKIGKTSFQVNDFKPCLDEIEYIELSNLTEMLGKHMVQLREMDNRMIQRLKIELESVKLEIHRMDGAKKTKNAYAPQRYYQWQNETRFIDQEK
jgi:hypothetical protein